MPNQRRNKQQQHQQQKSVDLRCRHFSCWNSCPWLSGGHRSVWRVQIRCLSRSTCCERCRSRKSKFILHSNWLSVIAQHLLNLVRKNNNLQGKAQKEISIEPHHNTHHTITNPIVLYFDSILSCFADPYLHVLIYSLYPSISIHRPVSFCPAIPSLPGHSFLGSGPKGSMSCRTQG